jgi:ABC-type sugar transport system ATPase subunit
VVAVSVEALEPQGAETLARCTTGAHTFTVRLPSASTVIAGQKLSLAIDLNYARFFDPLTGQAVA